MVTWLFVAFGVAIGSALLPLVSVELFVIGLASQRPDIPWLAIGLVVAGGQLAGKVPYYYAGRGTIRLPAWLRRGPRPLSARRIRWQLRFKRVRARLEAIRERCHRQPAWMVTTMGFSSVSGLPPFMATTILAGYVGMRLSTFLTTGYVGRAIRFCALAACPGLLIA
ncbi:membrane protein YqaA with SNARE-associated domain [Tamaricihabitans halophyticus]|uniref:Membrane protein YqaA with SNARE-associated domain n=1 Tax=Tamaricihabitans halophyticus TaxID=1262583 RepID=A0A4R2QL03_9PSEU|nr:hypothetical protein [Tamaricihabitans halophyticus]TCP50150.1 membrane protein YqaA with SNARE-associated domain [Tamaricihabitans halophyticus]